MNLSLEAKIGLLPCIVCVCALNPLMRCRTMYPCCSWFINSCLTVFITTCITSISLAAYCWWPCCSWTFLWQLSVQHVSLVRAAHSLHLMYLVIMHFISWTIIVNEMFAFLQHYRVMMAGQLLTKLLRMSALGEDQQLKSAAPMNTPKPLHWRKYCGILINTMS